MDALHQTMHTIQARSASERIFATLTTHSLELRGNMQWCRAQSRKDAEDMQWMLSIRRCTQYKPEAQASEYSPP